VKPGFRGPTGEGRGAVRPAVGDRDSRKKGDASRSALSAQSKAVFRAFARASLRLRTAA
jgi:hypothetical protein